MDDKSLKIICKKEFDESDDMYKLIDFLNKNLKKYKLVFGIRKKDKKNIITLYDEL